MGAKLPEPGRKIVNAACPHDCPDTCGMHITVENGVAVKVEGAKDMPFTQGTLCTKVARYLDRTYSKERVLHPLKRVGAKGEGKFERISWDEALTTIAAKFKQIAAVEPQSILPCSYAGTMGLVQYASMDRRFFHKLGASLLERTLCSSAGKVGMKITLGAGVGMDPERFDEAKLILIWGSNSIVSNLHLWSRVQEAKRRGARVIAIDPYRSLTAAKCDQHIAPLPGTDAALALGMMQVIISEGLYDADYVERHTLGFAQLRERVQDYPPQKVAAICGLAAGDIVALAREYAGTRQTAIRLNYGMQRHSGGGMAVRAITCLPALTGHWRDAAGGVVLSTGDWYGMNLAALERPDLIPNRPRTINQSALGDALTAANPPVRAIYVYNNNPVAVCPDSQKVIAGFRREDLFTVVHEIFLTDTADYADIVLPATTQLEHYDVHKSYGHLYVLANSPAIAPRGRGQAQQRSVPAARGAHGLYRRLLQRFGRGHLPPGAGVVESAHGRDRMERAEGAGMAAAQCACPLRPVCRGKFPHAFRKVRILERDGEEHGHGPAARVHAAARIGAKRAAARAEVSACLHLAAGAQFPQLQLRQSGVCAEGSRRTLSGHPSGRRRSARHRRWRSGAHLQRARLVRGQGARVRARAPGRGGGLVGVVEETLARWPQRQRGDVAGARRHGRSGDLLRLPGRGRARRRKLNPAFPRIPGANRWRCFAAAGAPPDKHFRNRRFCIVHT